MSKGQKVSKGAQNVNTEHRSSKGWNNMTSKTLLLPKRAVWCRGLEEEKGEEEVCAQCWFSCHLVIDYWRVLQLRSPWLLGTVPETQEGSASALRQGYEGRKKFALEFTERPSRD